MLTIGGPLGQAFGVCSNLLSPADGRVAEVRVSEGQHVDNGTLLLVFDSVGDDAEAGGEAGA